MSVSDGHAVQPARLGRGAAQNAMPKSTETLLFLTVAARPSRVERPDWQSCRTRTAMRRVDQPRLKAQGYSQPLVWMRKADSACWEAAFQPLTMLGHC